MSKTRTMAAIALSAVVSLTAGCGDATDAPAVTPSSPTRIAYGTEPSQFGDLTVPAAVPPPGGFRTVVLIHGGFWRAQFGLDLMEPLAADLVARGFAVWNIEYRRVGQPGGGYPGTLEDVAAAFDTLSDTATSTPISLADIAVVGHSAGGHLALWTAGRDQLPAGAPGAAPRVLPTLAIGQGPVVDLVAGDAAGLGRGAVTSFLGGTSSDVPERYEIATPATGGGARLIAVRGTSDGVVPAEFTVPPGGEGVDPVDVEGDHFDLIDPASAAWSAVVEILGLSGA
jgi:acetyl esterase/lipase